jgi:cell fate (sporulation/competence/biofilm development) regulator YlbF (YheA/YmcA/DUF963 family)
MRYCGRVVGAAFASLLLVACGGESLEKIWAEEDKIYGEMNDVLDDVTDVESAKEALPELESLQKELEEVQARMQRYGNDPDSQMKAMEEMQNMKDIVEKYQQQATFMKKMTKLEPEVREALADIRY